MLTDVTGERLKSCVFATVSDEVRRLTERLAAVSAGVRLLTCIRQSHAHARAFQRSINCKNQQGRLKLLPFGRSTDLQKNVAAVTSSFAE